MRFLPTVLKKMIAEIPSNELDFLVEMKDRLSSASYSAPENMRLWWEETQKTLIHNFPDPNNLNEWQQKVIDIWMDKA